MKKHISNNLRMATMVMGITITTSAGAIEVSHLEKINKTHDLLCMAIKGDELHPSALAVLRVEKNGQAQGALCYLGSLLDTSLDNCHPVNGSVLKAPGTVRASYVSLVGTGLNDEELTQTNVAVSFEDGVVEGRGAATTVSLNELQPITLNKTPVALAWQTSCKYINLPKPSIILRNSWGVNYVLQTYNIGLQAQKVIFILGVMPWPK